MRTVWIVGLVALTLPLCVAYAAGRARQAPARATRVTRQAAVGGAKVRSLPAPAPALARRPHPGLRLAGRLFRGWVGQRTASAVGVKLARSGA